MRAREAVQAAAAEGFRLPVDGGTLEIPPGRLSAMQVTTAPHEDGRLRAFARISIEGRLDGKPVSYVGDERFFVRCAGRCELDGPPAPRLLRLLEVLRARRAALEARDRERLAALAVPDARPQIARADLDAAAAREAAAWFIRIDRDEALVSETAPSGAKRQLILRWSDGAWKLVSGLP